MAILGALLVAAAAILYWVVVPGRKELPADTNTTRQLTGTARVLLNPQAIASGDLGNALLSDVPVSAERNVKVLATDGSAAQVSDTRVLSTANGQVVGTNQVTYAVDRKTLEAVANPPSQWQVTPHEGLTVSWPIGAGKQDYTAWVNETKSTTPVKYAREENKGGVSTYVYEATSTPAPITDEPTLATLPRALGASALAGLAGRLPLPDAIKSQLAQALPALGDPVPLSYTYDVKSTYWVEPTTGIVVDTVRTETRKASFAGGQISVPVYEVETRFDDASVAAAGTEAGDKRNSINTFSRTLPLLLLIPGLLLLLAGIIGILTARRTAPATVYSRSPGSPGANGGYGAAGAAGTAAAGTAAAGAAGMDDRDAGPTESASSIPPAPTGDVPPRGIQSPSSTEAAPEGPYPSTPDAPGSGPDRDLPEENPPEEEPRSVLPPKDGTYGPSTDGPSTDGSSADGPSTDGPSADDWRPDPGQEQR